MGENELDGATGPGSGDRPPASDRARLGGVCSRGEQD